MGTVRSLLAAPLVLALGLGLAACGDEPSRSADGAMTLRLASALDDREALDRLEQVVRARLAALGIDVTSIEVSGDRAELTIDGDADDVATLERTASKLLIRRGHLTMHPVLAVGACEELGSGDDVVPEAGGTGPCFVLGDAALSGDAIESATAAEDPTTGAWVVQLVLRAGARGIDALNELAAQCAPPADACPSGRLAIVVDRAVQTAPTVIEPAFERDQVVIAAEYSQRSAQDLAIILRAGALPVSIVAVERAASG